MLKRIVSGFVCMLCVALGMSLIVEGDVVPLIVGSVFVPVGCVGLWVVIYEWEKGKK